MLARINAGNDLEALVRDQGIGRVLFGAMQREADVLGRLNPCPVGDKLRLAADLIRLSKRRPVPPDQLAASSSASIQQHELLDPLPDSSAAIAQ